MLRIWSGKLPCCRLSRLLTAIVLTSFLLAASACTDDAVGPDEPKIEEGIGEGVDRLLSDAELLTAADANPAAVSASSAAWLNGNAHVIRSLTAKRFEDLQFLKTVIGSRRLVQLGESGHGVREFNMSKVRLIRFLHEEMGFDVIAFESGLYECWSTNERESELTADLMMRTCIFGVWHTAEVIQLFEYVKSTRATGRPLHLAGFDTQISSLRDSGAAQLLYSGIAPFDPTYAERVRNLERTFFQEQNRLARLSLSYEQWRDSVTASIARHNFIAAFDSAAQFFVAREEAEPSPALSRRVARQTAVSRAQYSRQLAAANSYIGFELRDIGMADNIDFLLDEAYTGKKVIVWAHNGHIQHDRRATTPLGSNAPQPRSMGSWVSGRRRSDLYTIGLFMYTGTAANNARQVYSVTGPAPHSLEALFYQPRKQWLFADMLSAGQGAGAEWMFTDGIAKEWGVQNYRMILRDQFDGILFIHTVSPPAYL